MVKEDLIDHQEMERRKALAIKENLVLQKKIIQNQLVLQITQNTLAKKHLKIHHLVQIKKTLALVEKRSLKAETTDLKVLPSKNIVKKELNLKTF